MYICICMYEGQLVITNQSYYNAIRLLAPLNADSEGSFFCQIHIIARVRLAKNQQSTHIHFEMIHPPYNIIGSIGRKKLRITEFSFNRGDNHVQVYGRRQTQLQRQQEKKRLQMSKKHVMIIWVSSYSIYKPSICDNQPSTLSLCQGTWKNLQEAPCLLMVSHLFLGARPRFLPKEGKHQDSPMTRAFEMGD